MKIKKKSVQKLIGFECFTKNGVKTDRAEFALFAVERTEDMQDLNEVAWQLHALSPEAVVKVKAIMEAADTFGIGGLRSAIRTMDE